jgi:hypothetical protein
MPVCEKPVYRDWRAETKLWHHNLRRISAMVAVLDRPVFSAGAVFHTI